MPFLGDQAEAPWVNDEDIRGSIVEILPETSSVMPFKDFDKALFEKIGIDRARPDFERVQRFTYLWIQFDLVTIGMNGVRRR